ncbi:metallophosphoesterase family protein [Thermus brockianus]|nr:metallophosphoesterase family protein [Thermus brockianus]
MRLGVLSDIHANLPALEAALEALRAEGVDEVLVLGDLVGYGPHPRQVVRRLMEEGLPAIAGAWDLRVAYPVDRALPEGLGKATLEWTRAQLGEKASPTSVPCAFPTGVPMGTSASWPSTAGRAAPRRAWTSWARPGSSSPFWSATGPKPSSLGGGTCPWPGGWARGSWRTQGAWG